MTRLSARSPSPLATRPRSCLAAWPTFVLLVLAFGGCDTGEGLRFRDGLEWYRFEGQPITVDFSGARLLSPSPDVETFTCPSGQQIFGEIPVFKLDATAATPAFEAVLPAGFGRCDTAESETFGVQLQGLPVDALDVYERCEPAGRDRLVNRCECEVVSCADTSLCVDPEAACTKRVDGKYKLVAVAQYLDDDTCRLDDGESREPYLGQPVEGCVACDAFSPVEITAALRGTLSEQDRDTACVEDELEQMHVAFCAQPCGCRTVRYELVPKEPIRTEADHQLKIAVISEVESDKSSFRAFAAEAAVREVDMIINIGDLSQTGGQAGVRKMGEFVESVFSSEEEDLCLDPDDPNDANGCFCRGMGAGVPTFMTGLGENEVDEKSFFTFFKYFGASNVNAVVGGVQIVVIDSADATLSSQQFNWIENELAFVRPSDFKCSIPGSPPNGLDHWPVLGNRDDCGNATSCIDCLQTTTGTAPLCVPPPADQDILADLIFSGTANRAPLNCMCLPNQTEACPGNFECTEEGSCICTRDEDCGPGGHCVDGDCLPPFRIVLTHTPPFDIFGARNSAFRSRREAARLMSLFATEGVNLVFAGSINTYAEVSTAGIPVFVTGGGGAPLEVFDDTGPHWILVTIGNAYGIPRGDDVTLEVIPIE